MPPNSNGITAPYYPFQYFIKNSDRLEENLELLAVAETWDNGKPIRETLAADIPLAIDHFRYFAGCIRAQKVEFPKLMKTPLPTIFMNL